MIPSSFYLNEINEISLYRRIKNGGDEFVTNYLEKFSERESEENYNLRKRLTPSAAFAKKEVMGVNNAIYQRLIDITRIGGSESYQKVIAGSDGGIDLDDSSMTHFIGQDVLSELLFMGVVGVLVDMPAIKEGSSVAEATKQHPYCYIYTREQIINFTEDQVNNRKTLTALKLQEYIPALDEFGLHTGDEKRYRVYNLLENGVRVRFLDEQENLVSDNTLDLSEIPFTIFKLPNSLLHETGIYQVALMNLESSDINYALKSNFPFYVEHESNVRGNHLDKEDEIEVGNVQGRSYSGDKEPNFINPSSEPLEVSMKKQEQIKDSIRQQINLAISSVSSKTADAKSMDERGLESGLSAIGEILEQGERKIAIYYSSYEGDNKVATVNYPDKYTLKSDKDLIEEVKLIQDQKEEMPSLSGKKALAKLAARKLFDTKLPIEDVKIILNEIDANNNVGASAKTIIADVEAGILSHGTGATMRGYNKDEAAKAEVEHAERLARIEEAQTRARENTMAAARGVNDKASDGQDAKEEKQESQDPNLNGDGKKLVRGEQK